MSFITRFFSSSSLTEEINVQIPSETTEISPKRFFNQTNLETVDFLGNQVNKIGHRAFYGCSKLRSITLEKCIYLQTIESEAFWECKSLTSISLPLSLQSIGDNSFRFCNLQQTIHLSQNMKAFYGSSFFGSKCSFTCENSNNFKSFNGDIYSADFKTLIAVSYSTKSLQFPSQCTTIGSSAFSSSSVTIICLPDTITSLEIWALHYGVNVVSITLSKGITNLSINSISVMPSLQRLIIPEGIISLKYSSISACNALKTLILPESLTDLEKNSFTNCPNIRKVSYIDKLMIPKYVEAGIPKQAFLMHTFEKREQIKSSFFFLYLIISK